MNIGGRTSFMTCLSLRWPVSLLSVLLLVVVPGQRGASAHGAPPSTSKPALTVTQESSLSQLRFEPNMGRGVRAVRFIARSSHALWLFSPRSIALDLNRGASHQEALRLAPVSPSPSTFITASEQLPGVTNYLLGNNPRTWQTGIPTFAQIRYHSIFPGIDLIFHGNGSTMELRWLVAPGGDPARIVLSVQNATRLRLASDGSLIATTAMGNIRQLAPHIYQTVGGRRRIVPGHFVLHARHRVGIWIGAYDRDRPLIIDPTLRYSATLSGSLDDDANAVAVDSAGNAYVTGSTQSDNFPVQTPLQPALGGENDAFVTKLDPTGKIIYSTYLGGSRSDEGFGLAVDGAGDVFVAGSTNSKNFPTTPGALQAKLGGGTCPNGGNTYACEDAFVVKLDPTGRVPLYSTYLGGNLEDYALGLALDSQRDAIVVGSTNSRNIP
ncbi:MAG: SBBP repeat-containing protein, partial [Chloroflexota bacterium]